MQNKATGISLRGIAVRILLAGLLAVLLLTALLIICLFVRSPGKIKPFTDEHGDVPPDSIAEKIYVEIGGIKQGMIIRGKDISNPVLLYMHGGPAMPNYFLTEIYPTALDEYFTVCWWEQRGSGLSYHPDMDIKSITVEQLLDDTAQVTNYLRERFGQYKIYLLGSSWGSYLGIQAAARTPELYHAYMGLSQVSRIGDSEELAYQYMLEQYLAQGNTRRAEQLKKAYADRDHVDNGFRDTAMHELGIGTMRKMNSVITGIFWPNLMSPVYTLGEKVNLWRAKFSDWSHLLSAARSNEAADIVRQLEIPVYFFGGRYDYTVSYPEGKAYLNELEASVKGFYTFCESAHQPIFEEPDRFMEIILTDVLNGTTTLADTD